jgi:hypothetical protein
MSNLGMLRSHHLVIVLTAAAICVGSSNSARAVILEFGTSGRFIAITNNGGVSRNLHVGELEAFTTGAYVSSSNLEPAYSKARTTAGASYESQIGSTAHGGNTAPLDGIRNSAGAVFTLNPGVGNQMVYDLGTTRNLSAVKLWQRMDGCCQDRLSNFTVSVMADNGSGLPGATVFSQSYAGQVPTESFAEFSTLTGRQIEPGNVGVIGTDVVGESAARYVRIRNNSDGSRWLGISEVEVFGAGVTPNAASGLSTNEISGAGFSFESQVASGGVAHGSNTSPFNNVIDNDGAVYTLNAGVASEYVMDLNNSFDIGQLRIFNRASCCQDRLANYTVSLLKDNGAGLPGDEVFAANVPGQTPTPNSFTQINVPTIPDAFTVLGTDNLVIDIDPGSNAADLLRIGSAGTGALSIDPGADLTLNFLNDNFLAGQWQTFNILDFATVSGSFGNNISFNNLNPRVMLDLSNLYTTGQISALATPEPVSLSLWLLTGLAAIIGCAYLRRSYAP